MNVIESPQRRLATQAMNALARLGDPEALQAAEALLGDPDEAVRARQLPVVVELRRRHGGDPLETLRLGLGDRRAPVREAALESALEVPDEALLAAVIPLLADRAERVRHLARQFILAVRCQDMYAVHPILRVLLDESQELDVRIGAIQSVMYPHQVSTLQHALMDMMEHPEVALRLWAGRALPFYEDRDTTADELLNRINQAVPRGVELSLLWAMARLANPITASLLRCAAQSGDTEVMEPAVHGLGLLGDPSCADLIRKVWHEAQGRAETPSSPNWVPTPV